MALNKYVYYYYYFIGVESYRHNDWTLAWTHRQTKIVGVSSQETWQTLCVPQIDHQTTQCDNELKQINTIVSFKTVKHKDSETRA